MPLLYRAISLSWLSKGLAPYFFVLTTTLFAKGFVDAGAEAGADVVDPVGHCSGENV